MHILQNHVATIRSECRNLQIYKICSEMFRFIEICSYENSCKKAENFRKNMQKAENSESVSNGFCHLDMYHRKLFRVDRNLRFWTS